MSDAAPDACWAMPVNLLELAEDGEAEVIREILGIFLEDTRERIESMPATMEAGDAQAVSRLGHGLKGGCAQIGAPRLAEIAAGWEAPGQSPEQWHELMELFRTEFRKVESLIRAHPLLQGG